MKGSPIFLMCPPEFFDVRYVINPWMQGNVQNVDVALARRQWHALYEVLRHHANVRIVRQVPSSPDMVFTANAGLVRDRTFFAARFRHEERQSEEPYFAEWFRDHAFDVRFGPLNVAFEGAGDALFDGTRPWLWLGHGHRSVLDAGEVLHRAFDLEVVPLELVDPRFYHLDTCLCPLPRGEVLYHPAAFSMASIQTIESRVPADLRIVVEDEDALAFACNAVAFDSTIVLHAASPRLERALVTRGYSVITTPLTEFLKAGGSAKCLTLRVG